MLNCIDDDMTDFFTFFRQSAFADESCFAKIFDGRIVFMEHIHERIVFYSTVGLICPDFDQYLMTYIFLAFPHNLEGFFYGSHSCAISCTTLTLLVRYVDIVCVEGFFAHPDFVLGATGNTGAFFCFHLTS